MAAQTPTYLIPYPTGTDRVTDGDNAMQAIAERVELVWQFYYTTVVMAASTTTISKTLNYAGLSLTAAPSILAVCSGKGTDQGAGFVASVLNVTSTTATLRVDKLVGAAPSQPATIGVALLVGATKTVLP